MLKAQLCGVWKYRSFLKRVSRSHLRGEIKISANSISCWGLFVLVLTKHNSTIPHIQHTPSLNCYHLVDATELWAPERPDTGTVSSLKLSISWTLDIKRGTHNTITHYLFTTHTYFFISILHISDLYTHNCLYYILCFCYFVHCLFVYYYFIICVLSCCCHSVALWSFCHYNKFLVCVNIPGQ